MTKYSEYAHISKAKYEAMGYKVEEIDGGVPVRIATEDAVNIIVDQTDKEVIIIPSTIDGKRINTVTDKSIAMHLQDYEKPRAVIFLGDVDKVEKFLNFTPNLDKVFLFGDIKNISTSFIGSNVTSVDNNGNYLKIESNDHYALMNILKDCDTFDIHPETRLVASQAFQNNNKI